MKIISKSINTPIQLVATKQWSKSLQNIRKRKCDILPIAMDVPSRRDSMNFTKPYVSEPFVIATTNDKLFIKDINDLSNKKIGIVKSYAYIEVLKSQNPLIKIVEVINTKKGLEKVSSGELFGYIDTMPTIGYFIQKYGMIDLKIAGRLDYEIKLSIASRNDEPFLNSIMQKTLNTISKDKIRTIVGEWIKIKVEQSFDYSKLFYIIGFFSIVIFLILYKNRSIHLINKKLNLANKKLNEERKTIESLTHTQQSLLSLFDKGDAVLFKLNIKNKSKVEFISKSIYGLTGFSTNDFISAKVIYSDCIYKEDLEAVVKKNKEALVNKTLYFRHEPYRIVTKDGIEKWVLDYRVAEIQDGEIVYILGYISDVTEHIKHQENIAHQAKMISLGEMIGNIAHQWRQPLSLISSVATGSMLQKEISTLSDNDFDNNMNLINDNVQYLSKTIDDFRSYVKGNRDLVRFNLSKKIDTFLNLVNPSVLNHKISILQDCDTSIELESYPNDLIQSLINIYNNSKDVLKELPEEERYFFINTKEVDNKVVISLKDTGRGISEEMLNKVFEPYTTTKHQSQGTGLGMNITYNFIVEGMKGNIRVKNSNFNYEGKEYIGAEFIIYLPNPYKA
jgi:PAS domain S-box-containing protein